MQMYQDPRTQTQVYRVGPIKHNRRNISYVCKAILLKKLEENNYNGNLRALEKESLILFYYEHVSTSRKYRKVCTHKGSGVEGWLIMLTYMISNKKLYERHSFSHISRNCDICTHVFLFKHPPL